jgi:hypothetical protein
MSIIKSDPFSSPIHYTSPAYQGAATNVIGATKNPITKPQNPDVCPIIVKSRKKAHKPKIAFL